MQEWSFPCYRISWGPSWTQVVQLSLESQILDSCPAFAVMAKWFSLTPETPVEVSGTVSGCCRNTG